MMILDLVKKNTKHSEKHLHNIFCNGSSQAGSIVTNDYFIEEDTDFSGILNGLAHTKAVEENENSIQQEMNDDIKR